MSTDPIWPDLPYYPPGMNLKTIPERGEITPQAERRYREYLKNTPLAPAKPRRIIFHGVGTREDPYVVDDTESDDDCEAVCELDYFETP
jgi:hypothetical protein